MVIPDPLLTGHAVLLSSLPGVGLLEVNPGSLLPLGEPVAVWIPWLLGLGLLLAFVAFVLLPGAKEWLTDFRAWRRACKKDQWMKTARQLMENGDHEAALAYFERVTEAFPSDIQALHARATCLEEAQRFEEAADAYLEGHRSVADGEPGFLTSAARCALHAGDRERAVDILVDAHDLSPTAVRRMLNDEAYADLLEDDRLRERVSPRPSRPSSSEPDIV